MNCRRWHAGPVSIAGTCLECGRLLKQPEMLDYSRLHATYMQAIRLHTKMFDTPEPKRLPPPRQENA